MRFKKDIVSIISIFLVFAGLLSVISAVDSNNSSYSNTTIYGIDPPEPINNNITIINVNNSFFY
jgi:hypothetical protein